MSGVILIVGYEVEKVLDKRGYKNLSKSCHAVFGFLALVGTASVVILFGGAPNIEVFQLLLIFGAVGAYAVYLFAVRSGKRASNSEGGG